MAIKLVTFDDVSLEIHLDQPATVVGDSWPVGSIHISVSPINPATTLGFGTWVAFGTGRVLIALDPTNSAFDTVEETGGALTIPAAGSNSAPAFTGTAVASEAVSAGTPAGSNSTPTFTGSSAATSAVSAGTPAGTVSQPTLTMNSYTPTGTVGAPIFSGSPLANHAHELPFIKVAGATGALRMLASSVFGVGTSRAPESVSAAPTGLTTAAAVELSQAVSAGTPAGTNSVPPFTGSAFTLTGTISQPSFTGAALSAHSHTVVATGTVSAPAFTGSALPTHQHNVTAAGTVAAPTFTGTPSSVVQPYIVVFMWKRTA